ncbi:hypothetical protein ACLB2K_073777 [Fragaria x ananassa]
MAVWRFSPWQLLAHDKMTASLASKLSLKDVEELIDLGNLHCPKKGFLVSRFYSVGKLNIVRPMVFNSLQSTICSMWQLSISMERSVLLLNHSDGFSNITVIPLDFVWIWVEVSGLPPALLTEETVNLIGKTIWRAKGSGRRDGSCVLTRCKNHARDGFLGCFLELWNDGVSSPSLEEAEIEDDINPRFAEE